MLEIKRIRTSPYHPESDGMLERWHASMKSMIKKTELDHRDWDKCLKYMLFAYRSTPHSVTVFSPFELIYGRDVRGPLELLKDGWMSGELPERGLHDWVEQLKERMEAMAQLASTREKAGKVRMKQTYDKMAKGRSFEMGSMVLMRVPGLTGKLENSWEGPYEVLDKTSPVNYQLAIPGRARKPCIVHVNMLHQWNTPDARVLKVVVAEEDEDEHTTGHGPSDSNLDMEQKAELDTLLNSFSDVINTTPGRASLVEHVINTSNSPPLRTAPYHLSQAWKDQLQAEIHDLLAAGIIWPSLSPWSSPIIPVRKKDGSVRLCVDFRRINAVSVPDPYLMPRVDEIIDRLGKAQSLSKLDLNKGFRQVPVNPSDIEKTAFCAPAGKFEYVFMPFGLQNAPATFQRLMDQVLVNMMDFARAYIDDVVVYSESWEEHLRHLQTVLERFREVGLTAKPSKCEWAAASFTYLGHVVGRGQVRPEEGKVKAARDFARPITKTDIRSFLGLTTYYRNFVDHYADNSVALTAATRKTAPTTVEWTQQMEEEFRYIKDSLCCVPFLIIPTEDDTFVLQADASGTGIGAMLSVKRDTGEKPVAFFSRKLLPREQKYSATELEGLAVVDAITHFGIYLISSPFTVETDHRALSFLNTCKLTNGRLARWAMKLQS